MSRLSHGLPVMARLYRLAVRLLPAHVRRQDGDEMVLAFLDLWLESRGVASRSALVLKLFSGVFLVACAEWADVLGITRSNAKGVGLMGLGRNLRFALRTLRKAPAFTFTTILLIGLGVGSVTTIFTLVDHVLLRPLPYPQAERLITVEEGSHSAILFRGFEQFNSVEAWAAGHSEDANLVGDGDPLRIEQAEVSRGFFALFGGRPAAGRLLIEDDFAAANSVVLSHAMWQRVFGSDREIVGGTIRIDGEAVTVVGVLEQGFEPPQALVASSVDVWKPIDWSREDFDEVGYHILQVAGRMSPGATEADVQAELDALAARMAVLYPVDMVGRDGEPEVLPVAGLQDSTVQRVRSGLNLLLGAVGLLLLVACLNVAHLFLARGLGRVQEMAVRRALGAGAGGLLRQLLAESLVVGAGGGALGLLIAAAGLQTFLAMNPGTLPRSTVVTVDLRVLAFTAAVALATAVLFGLLPALRSVGGDLSNELKGKASASRSSRATSRTRNLLVIAEVAMSLVLVAEAGLLLKSFVQVQSQGTGLDAESVWTIPLTPTGIDEPEQYVLAMDAIEGSLASLPGVTSATYGISLPFQFTGGNTCCWSTSALMVDGQEIDGLRVMMQPVTAPYFETLGIEILAGRIWSNAEQGEDPAPIVLSERLAVDLFASANRAVGQVIARGDDGPRFRVTGVVADTKHYGLDRPTPQALFMPVSAVPFAMPLAHMAVRIRGDAPAGLAQTLREAVWRASPEMPVPTVRSMDAWIDLSTAGRRFDSVLFGAFGVVALLLAAAGLYGTLLYTVRQRRRELGIRLALGAERTSIERGVVANGFRLALIGSVLGVGGAWGVGRFLEARLFEVPATDPATLASAVGVLLATAMLASWLPARRAGRTDPLETLKAE